MKNCILLALLADAAKLADALDDRHMQQAKAQPARLKLAKAKAALTID